LLSFSYNKNSTGRDAGATKTRELLTIPRNLKEVKKAAAAAFFYFQTLKRQHLTFRIGYEINQIGADGELAGGNQVIR
jgi:hypothetical protein